MNHFKIGDTIRILSEDEIFKYKRFEKVGDEFNDHHIFFKDECVIINEDMRYYLGKMSVITDIYENAFGTNYKLSIDDCRWEWRNYWFVKSPIVKIDDEEFILPSRTSCGHNPIS